MHTHTFPCARRFSNIAYALLFTHGHCVNVFAYIWFIMFRCICVSRVVGIREEQYMCACVWKYWSTMSVITHDHHSNTHTHTHAYPGYGQRPGGVYRCSLVYCMCVYVGVHVCVCVGMYPYTNEYTRIHACIHF